MAINYYSLRNNVKMRYYEMCLPDGSVLALLAKRRGHAKRITYWKWLINYQYGNK